MKTHLRISILILLTVTLVSCQKKKEDEALNGGQGAPPAPAPDYSLHCEENFSPTWCGMNREISTITEVCVGQLTLQDEAIEAISLQTADSATCYVFSGHSTDVTYSGCAVAKNNEYVGDFQGNEAMESVVCYSQGRPAYLEGSSPSGEIFRTFHIE